MNGGPDEPLVTLALTIDAADIEAFADALGLPASPVPPTYPIRLLFHPDIRAALTAFLPADGSLPIHIGQRFHYHRPLRPGERVTCIVRATAADDARPLAGVRLEVTDSAGAAICRAESEIAIAAPGFTWERAK